MADSKYPIYFGGRWLDVTVPDMDGEGLIVPNVCALLYKSAEKHEIFLQKRDKPDELVRGKLELPGGRWRAGESPVQALSREVFEETGLTLRTTGTYSQTYIVDKPDDAEESRSNASVAFISSQPLMVVSGFELAYPALLVVFECVADEGTPRALQGETADPQWYAVDDVKQLLTTSPEAFTGPTFAVLSSVFK